MCNISIEFLRQLVGEELDDGFIIKSFHLYSDKVNLTLINCSQMKTETYTYEEIEELFV